MRRLQLLSSERALTLRLGNQFLPLPLAVEAYRTGCQEDLFGEGCERSAVSSFFRVKKRMNSFGKETEAILESLAQAGVSQTATGNPTVSEPSSLPFGHATHPAERAAFPLSYEAVCLASHLLATTTASPSTLPLKGVYGRDVCYSPSSSKLCR
ncbi:hypothetical protein MRX96_015481 [Rhipicephalus microplus]